MCPLFMSITTHAAWAFLIIILSLLINEFVLAILFHHFFLLVDFLSRHLWGGYIKLVGLSAVRVFIAHRQGMCWDQTALSLESVSLVCRMINKGPLPHLFSPLDKTLCTHYLNYLAEHILGYELHYSLYSYN